MSMNKIILKNDEIQESPFSDHLRSSLESVINNAFFTRLSNEKISIEGYRFFIKEKYSAVGSFVNLLENAERLSKSVSQDLSDEFKANRLDEIGYFAGEINPNYNHEEWLMRSLKTFGVDKKDLKGLQLDSSKKHEEITIKLSQSQNTFKVIGALLFLELFVVYEMKRSIEAFERDLPTIFPKNTYSYDKFPFNTQEYWYGHALHDTWHFRSIEEPLISFFKKHSKTESELESLLDGISEVAKAENSFYSELLFEKMKSLS